MGTNILFTGDLSASGIFAEKMESNEEIFDKKLLKAFDEKDFIICNLEGAITKKENLKNRNIRVVNPMNTASYLKQRNISILNLANNHVFDCGKDGFLDTKSEIEKENLIYFGAGENINEAAAIKVVEKNNIKIGLFGVAHKEGMIADEKTAGIFFENDLYKYKNEIHSIKNETDWLILNYHGGEEFTTYPSPMKRKRLKKIMLDFDFDMIVSHHSHVFQGYEYINNKPVFYSLGNFIFDIPEHAGLVETKNSALLNIHFEKEQFEIGFIPIYINVNTGFVEKGNEDFKNSIFNRADFNNYSKKWRKTAYKTYFEENRKLTNKSGADQNLRNKSFIKQLFNPKAYFSFIKQLIPKSSRQIVLSAMWHKFFS